MPIRNEDMFKLAWDTYKNKKNPKLNREKLGKMIDNYIKKNGYPIEGGMELKIGQEELKRFLNSK